MPCATVAAEDANGDEEKRELWRRRAVYDTDEEGASCGAATAACE
jgi:hypothetical protein